MTIMSSLAFASFVRSSIDKLRLMFPDLAEDADTWEILLEGETDLHEILTRIVREEREVISFTDALGLRLKELCARRDRFTRKKEALRSLMHSLLDAAELKSLRLPEATLSITNGRVSCVVTDETALPDEYVQITRTPKKLEITKALASGQSIPGAMLRNNPPYLAVRVV